MSFKEIQKNTINQVKELIKIVQDLIMKIETVHKSQTEAIWMECLGKRSGTTDASITNRM